MNRPRAAYNSQADSKVNLRRKSPDSYGPSRLRLFIVLLFYLLLASFVIFSYIGEESPIHHDLQLETPIGECSAKYIKASFYVRNNTDAVLSVKEGATNRNFIVSHYGARNINTWPERTTIGTMNGTQSLEFVFNLTYNAVIEIAYQSGGPNDGCFFYENAFSLVITHPPGSFHEALYFFPLSGLIAVTASATTIMLRNDFQYMKRILWVKLGYTIETSENTIEKVDLSIDQKKGS